MRTLISLCLSVCLCHKHEALQESSEWQHWIFFPLKHQQQLEQSMSSQFSLPFGQSGPSWTPPGTQSSGSERLLGGHTCFHQLSGAAAVGPCRECAVCFGVLEVPAGWSLPQSSVLMRSRWSVDCFSLLTVNIYSEFFSFWASPVSDRDTFWVWPFQQPKEEKRDFFAVFKASEWARGCRVSLKQAADTVVDQFLTERRSAGVELTEFQFSLSPTEIQQHMSSNWTWLRESCWDQWGDSVWMWWSQTLTKQMIYIMGLSNPDKYDLVKIKKTLFGQQLVLEWKYNLFLMQDFNFLLLLTRSTSRF